MPLCPRCSRPMATVLKREGGMVKTYHECPYCNDERASKEDKQAKPDREQHSGGPRIAKTPRCRTQPPPARVVASAADFSHGTI